jgi:hypothetical protein
MRLVVGVRACRALWPQILQTVPRALRCALLGKQFPLAIVPVNGEIKFPLSSTHVNGGIKFPIVGCVNGGIYSPYPKNHVLIISASPRCGHVLIFSVRSIDPQARLVNRETNSPYSSARGAYALFSRTEQVSYPQWPRTKHLADPNVMRRDRWAMKNPRVGKSRGVLSCPKNQATVTKSAARERLLGQSP